MEQCNIKSLKKFKATGLCSFLCALLTLLFSVSMLVFIIQVFIKSPSYKVTSVIVLVLLILLFLVTTFFNILFEWYIDARLEKKHGKWYITYFEALGFLGIDKRTEVEILELTGYDIKKKSISFYGKFKTHEQMSKSENLKSITVTGKFEDEQKAVDILNKLTGYIQPPKEDIEEELLEESKEDNVYQEESEMSAEEVQKLLDEYNREEAEEKELENSPLVIDTDDIVGSIMGRERKEM